MKRKSADFRVKLRPVRERLVANPTEPHTATANLTATTLDGLYREIRRTVNCPFGPLTTTLASIDGFPGDSEVSRMAGPGKEKKRLILGVPKESYPGERRVAIVPAVIARLAKAGLEVVGESGAGEQAGYPDSMYVDKGAKIADRMAVFGAADIVVQVLAYGSNDATGRDDLPLLRRGQVLIGFLRPFGSAEVVQEIAAAGVTSFSVELVPRTTRAQSMDALSSMGTICGYKAVLVAAETSPRVFPMLTTAAGTITPARVFVIGAGVAGLQAIATARRLGAVASAYDMRPAAKEQVQSLGGRFVELPIEAQNAQDARGYGTAQQETFDARQRELPRTGETVVVDGVPIIGAINLATSVPYHASQMYARNITTFLLYMVKEGKLQLNLQDEIIRETMITNGGEVVNARVREFFKMPALASVG